MAKRLIVVCGLSFAGKTTLANAICEEFRHPQVDVDETKDELYGEDIRDLDLSREQWKDIYHQTDIRIRDYLQSGRSVVDGSRNFRKEERDNARCIAESAGGSVMVVYINTPESIARERWRANRIKPTRRDITDEDFEEIVAVMEPPSVDEAPVIFHYDDAISTWLVEHSELLSAKQQ